MNVAGKDLFISLYASWCHSAMATISLCLLAQVGIYYLQCLCILEGLSFFTSSGEMLPFMQGLSTCKFCYSITWGRGHKCQVLGSAGQVNPSDGNSNLCLPKIAGTLLSS